MVGEPLYLDSGNTRLKWSFRGNVGVFVDDAELIDFAVKHDIKQIVLATVTLRYTQLRLLDLLPELAVCELKVVNNCLGLALAYSDISKLGVDRWLNMLAVIEESHSKVNIVVSMGTAMTVDVVDNQKTHLGGYIVPGLATQALSLNQHAAALPIVGIGRQTRLGSNTYECISNGVLKSSCALVESLASEWPVGSVGVTVTGGDGAYLSESLSIQHTFHESLIFEGMRAYWQSYKKTLG